MKTTFNPQAFLAGLSPGNYGTLLPPHSLIIPHLDKRPDFDLRRFRCKHRQARTNHLSTATGLSGRKTLSVAWQSF